MPADNQGDKRGRPRLIGLKNRFQAARKFQGFLLPNQDEMPDLGSDSGSTFLA
jgi:hypothetical protein